MPKTIATMNDPVLITQLRQALQGDLPGIEVQSMMMSRHFKKLGPNLYTPPSESARKAAVMALLFQKEGEWYTALMQRPESNYAHSRQVSFPGGSLEVEDEDMAACAKRETEEEFGILRTNIELVGALSELYISASGFLVQPYVGYLRQAPTYTPNAAEVEEILEIPLAHLLDPKRRKMTEIPLPSGMVLQDVPYFDVHDKIVWGATAMMLSELVYLLEGLYAD